MFYQMNAAWCSYDGDILIIFILQLGCLGSIMAGNCTSRETLRAVCAVVTPQLVALYYSLLLYEQG